MNIPLSRDKKISRIRYDTGIQIIRKYIKILFINVLEN